MRLISILIIFTILCSVKGIAQTEILTNQSIIDMVDSGFSEGIILAKIRNTRCDFNTDVTSLKILKEKNVSDHIIVAMINASRKIGITPFQNNYYTVKEKVGIYCNKSGEHIKLLPSILFGTVTNIMDSAYGMTSFDIKSILYNPVSNNIIQCNNPEFLFYFPSSMSYIGVDMNNWYFYFASSPKDFLLVKLDVVGERRELKTGSVNAYLGTNVDIDGNSIIPFNIIKTDNYIYKVMPIEPLDNGEYCFLYKGTTPYGGYISQSVFDFSISTGY